MTRDRVVKEVYWDPRWTGPNRNADLSRLSGAHRLSVGLIESPPHRFSDPIKPLRSALERYNKHWKHQTDS
ncbi:hypothetical protein BGX23_012464, partial [Mortierella sp. AD031]